MYRGFACFCHKSEDEEELCQQFASFRLNDGESVVLYCGGAERHYVNLSDWKQESVKYFDRFFSKRLNDVICVPEEGDIVLATLKEWVQGTQHGSKQGALIVQNINLLEQMRLLKISENNFMNCKNAAGESSCYLLFNYSESIIIYLRNVKDVSDKENLNEGMRLCISDIHRLMYLYQDELKNSGIRIIGLIVSNNEIKNLKLNCEFCKIFVVSSKIFENSDSFDTWLGKYDALLELSESDLFQSNQESFSSFCAKMLSLMACAKCTYLPNFTKSVASQIDQLSLLLTPEQMDIIYSTSKCTILKGNFGTGKTIVLQKKIQNLAARVDRNQVIYYFNYDRKSNAIIGAKNFIEKNCSEKSDQIKIRENRKGLKLSGIFSSILEEVEREVKSAHIFIDEFNGEELTQSEIEILQKNLKNDYFKDSVVFIAAQPVETERTDTFSDQPKIHKSETNLFDKLKDIFKIELLTNVMRTTVENNTVMKVMQKYLENKHNEFTHITKSDASSSSRNIKQHSPIKEKPGKALDLTGKDKVLNNATGTRLRENADHKQTNFLRSQGHVKHTPNSSDLTRSNEKKGTIPDVTVAETKNNGDALDSEGGKNNEISNMDGIDDLDQAFKQAAEIKVTHEKVAGGSKTISRYKFICESEIGHQIKSSNPKLIIPHHSDSDFESAVTYLAVLDLLDVARKRTAIIHFEPDTPPAWIKALKHFSRSYTDDVKDYMTKNDISILVTNFRFVRGMEFENVCVMVDADEYYLKHFVPEAIGRCTRNLSLLLLGRTSSNSKEGTVQEIVDLLEQQEPLVVEKWITERCKCNRRNKFYCRKIDGNLTRVGIDVLSDKFVQMNKKYLASNGKGGVVDSVGGAKEAEQM